MTRVLRVAGTSTSVVEAGDGPPLLLLHGGIECGGPMWSPVLTQLARSSRVVAPDVPGLGESSPLPSLDVDSFTRWLETLMTSMGIQRPTVIAHSLVGSLAARVAVRRSDLFGALVLYGAPAIGPYRMPMRLRYVALRFALRPTARNAERFDRFALLDLNATRRRDPSWFAAFDCYNRARAGERWVQRTMRHIVATQTKPISDAELRNIVAPVSLLWGRSDRMVPLAIGESAHARHGWGLHVVEEAAHAPHIEQPDAFVETVRPLLG